MDYPKFIVSNVKGESKNVQRAKQVFSMMWFLCWKKVLGHSS